MSPDIAPFTQTEAGGGFPSRLTFVIRPSPEHRLNEPFADDGHALRERVLWRTLYETAARTEEVLSLNIEDLDAEFRRTASPAKLAKQGIRSRSHSISHSEH
ncbi:hypothetical protein ACFQY7_24240 [Actinomadura luteofluorescens]|uniref:Integrase n=1 Tax=Actinomadura luteofluorescens TaxID=46163 RepID=A0A7Y9JIT4_9ACTN|nr:hypothetical protein [Actinomadura luteofluorescens]NYD50767.1 integrase [Actinomadura luteofluorescens]